MNIATPQIGLQHLPFGQSDVARDLSNVVSLLLGLVLVLLIVLVVIITGGGMA